MYQNFDEIVDKARDLGPQRAAILFPDDTEVMQATMEGMREGLITPVLVGEKEHITVLARNNEVPLETVEIIDQGDPQEAANLCLDMVKRGEASFVVKGNVLTTYLYRALIRATRQLAPDQTPCTLCFHQLPGINKIFVVTDPGVNILPDLNCKQKILNNAIRVLRALGCDNPHVLVFAARRLDGSSSAFAHDAKELRRLADEGKFGRCQIDAATNLFEILDEGGISDKWLPDIFLVPNIEAGNILVKSIDHILGGIRQCVTVGAGLTVLTPSRSDGHEIRIGNLVLGKVLAAALRRD